MPNEPVTFVVFNADVVAFALKRILQVEWKFPYQTSTHRKTFHATVGEAVLVFRDRHSDEFSERIDEFPAFVAEDAETAIEYLEHFVGTHFKGRVPLMELLVYCAFLVDLCVCCVENGRTDLVDDIVSESYDVYADHVRPYFDIVGGWLALLHVARDYLDFVESMGVYSVLVATDPNSKNDEAMNSAIADVSMNTKDKLAKMFRDTEVKSVKSISFTCSESNGATSAMSTNNIVSLETKDIEAMTTLSDLDKDYIQAIKVETSSIDSEDIMSISSTETDDGGFCRTINNALAITENLNIAETTTSSPLTENEQETSSETASSHSEDLISVASFLQRRRQLHKLFRK